MATGNGNARENRRIQEFFTKLKQLPKEYKEKKWGLVSEIPTCENIVADEDYWANRERSFPSLTEKKMQGVYEIKRELLSHSAVILNSKREDSNNSNNSTKKEDPRFPLLSYFKYDETTPLYQGYSSKSPYIELDPSPNFSSSIRRSCLKSLPLETVPKAEDLPSEDGNWAHSSEMPNVFSCVKKDPSGSQHNFSYLFSSTPNRNFFNGSTKPNAMKLRKNGKDYKVVHTAMKELQESARNYFSRMKSYDSKKRESFVEFLRKKKTELDRMLANPNYGYYVDAINNNMKLIEKTLSYIQDQSI